MVWVQERQGKLPGSGYSHGVGWGQQIMVTAGNPIQGNGLFINQGYLPTNALYQCPSLMGSFYLRNVQNFKNGWVYSYAINGTSSGGAIWVVRPTPVIHGNSNEWDNNIAGVAANNFAGSAEPKNPMNGVAATTSGVGVNALRGVNGYYPINTNLSQMHHASETLWFSETLSDTDVLGGVFVITNTTPKQQWYALMPALLPVSPPPHRGRKAANVCYFDGHVETVRTTAMPYKGILTPCVRSYDFPTPP
jgi:prepilin-type processing-associated H-X9-DG protein